ncbi:MAG: right-handed parallel beta-helix repeat-containing protein, partial [Candidatus Desulfofervidus auxilii]|nr:right-handed parallel beta-helix repeat-containing protein [Candidatus Desulfofervidus auxilii]
ANSQGILIEKCLIENNKYSLLKELSLPNKGNLTPHIEGDTIFTDTLTGIYTYNAEVKLRNNRIINNYTGVYACGSLTLYSYGNYIKDNIWHGYDLAVSGNSNLVFEKDTFINNGWYPLSLSSLTNEIFLYIIEM